MTIRCETAEESEELPEADIPLLTAGLLTRLHSKLDSDGDGKVSLKEILAAPLVVDKAIASEGVKQVFQDLDKSGDGRLSLEEHLADMPQATGEGDGYSPEQREELKARNELEAAKFKAADANDDRFL